MAGGNSWLLVVAALALSGCGGEASSGMVGVTAGGNGGRSGGGEAAASTGGNTSGIDGGGSGGEAVSTGGNTSGTGGIGGTVSPGKVSIEFTMIGPDSYCSLFCRPFAPAISIEDSSGQALQLVPYDQDCETCDPLWTPHSCPALGKAVTDIKTDWDGTVYEASTCGDRTSCVEARFAPPGKYKATFCATPGTLTDLGDGLYQCMESAPAKCGSVVFDFPSSTVVQGTVGP